MISLSVPNVARVVDDPRQGGGAVLVSGGVRMLGRETIVGAHGRHVKRRGELVVLGVVFLGAADAPAAAMDAENDGTSGRGGLDDA
jgi:hypothetical protein